MIKLHIALATASLLLATAASAEDRICREIADQAGIYYAAPDGNPIRLNSRHALPFNTSARFYIVPDSQRHGDEGVWHVRIFTTATTAVEDRNVRLTRNRVKSRCVQAWSRFKRDNASEDRTSFSSHDDFVNRHDRQHPIMQNWNFDADASGCFNTADKIAPIELIDGSSSKKAFAEAHSVGVATAQQGGATGNRRVRVADLTAALVFKPSDDSACHSFAMPRTRTGFFIFGKKWTPAQTKIEFWRLSNIGKEEIFRKMQTIRIDWTLN